MHGLGGLTLAVLMAGGAGAAAAQDDGATLARPVEGAASLSSIEADGVEAVMDGADDPSRATSLTFHFENDGTFLRPAGYTDRHYTSGQGFSVAWHGAGRGIADGLGLEADGTALGLALVQQMYTPDNIDEPPAPDDRFYAGYLYFGGFWQRQQRGALDHVQLDIGVIGPSSGAEAVQEWVHDVTDVEDPDWSDQLRDELAVNLTYRRKWRIDLHPAYAQGKGPAIDDFIWQAIPEVGFDMGSVYRRAHAGVTLRGGVNLPDDFGPTRLTDIGSAAGRSVRGVSGYGFVQAVGRVVEWNTFIEGSNTRNPSPSLDAEPFVGEVGVGFAIEWRRGNWVAGMNYRVAYLSDEFEEQTTTDFLGSASVRVLYEW